MAEETVATTAWARHAWQPRDGLPDEPVTAIVPLVDGSLLVGSKTRHCRLDGERVRLLAPGDPQAAKLDEVPLDPWLAAGRAAASPCTSRCRTADGTVFAGSLNGPPRRSRDGAEHRFTAAEGVRIDADSHVAADAHGRVWLAQSGLLAEYEPKQRLFIARAELPVGRITIAPARDEGLWIKVNTQVFRYRDGAGLSLQGGKAPHGSTILYEDSAGRLWAGSDFFGLYLLDNGSFEPVATDGEGVFAIAEDPEGGLWIGTSTAVNRMWPSVIGGIVAAESGMQLPNSLCEDRDGRIWLATESGWLGSIDARGGQMRFLKYGQAEGWSGIAHCVAAGPDGEIFIGTRTDGIHRYDGNVFEKIESPPDTPPTLEFGEYRILQLLASRCGDLWAVTYSGLCRHRDDHWTRAKVTGDRAVDLRLPKAIVEDTAGTVWVAAADGSLCRFAAGGGLDAEGEAVAVETSAAGRVAGLAAAPHGDLWAVVRDVGLLRIRDGQSALVGAGAGLPSATIVAMAADASGLLWCVTSRQIFAVTLAELDAIADGRQDSLHPWLFSGEDEGVVIDPADRPHCQAVTTHDGKIWITLRRGLAIVDPARLARLVGPPPVAIEALLVAGRPVAIESIAASGSAGERVSLPPDPRGVAIEIAVRGFTRPSNARVAYRLDGFDADWIERPDGKPIRYERLPVGSYALRLRSEHDRGSWESGPRSFVIEVQPQLWERPWFRAGALLLAAGLAAAAALGGAALRNRSRLARVEQQAALERQRMRIARDMHDEAGTTATQLALLAELARASSDGPARAERLEGVARIARQLVTSLDEMVWAVNPTNDTLAHLSSYLGQTASVTLGRFGVACRVRVPDPPPASAVTAEVRRGLLLIAKEAISNIIEHAEATAVEIEIDVRDGWLRMTIQDDGRGLDNCRGLPEATNGRPHGSGGNGLGNMQARAADLGGWCRIEPALPPAAHGTRVIVEVPLESEVHA
jgi:signal transduction histidine kinase/ligand-binding sensor domain-containing protein